MVKRRRQILAAKGAFPFSRLQTHSSYAGSCSLGYEGRRLMDPEARQAEAGKGENRGELPRFALAKKSMQASR